MSYETLKALHIISFVAWFAGLFYLPRLFVYHVKAIKHKNSDIMLRTMEYKLLNYITTPAMILTYIFGVGLMRINLHLMSEPWMHIKLTLVTILTIYHISLYKFLNRFAQGKNVISSRFFRIYNEIPTILLIGIIFLAVFKS